MSEEQRTIYDILHEVEEIKESQKKSGLYYFKSGDVLVFFDTREMENPRDEENFKIYGAKEVDGELKNTNGWQFLGVTKRVKSEIESMKSENLDSWSD